MQEFKVENNDINTNLIYELKENEAADMVAIEMIQQNSNIPGLLKMIYTQNNSLRLLKYNITSKITLQQLLERNVTKKVIISVLTNTIRTLISADEYLLEQDCFVLDMEKIYVDLSSYEVGMIYLPLKMETKKVDYSMFFKNLILISKYDATENCEYVAQIISYLNSASFSLFIYQALQMRKAGYSYEDTIKVLEALRNDGRIMFTTESLEYLSKGGRLAKTAITITSKLSLRPIIVMKEGEIGLGGFTRTRNKGKSNVIDMIQKYIESKGMPIENWDITVGYCTNLEEAEKYRDDVEAQLGVKLLERREDFKTRISIISGCHTGPYALGIACIPKYTTIRL